MTTPYNNQWVLGRRRGRRRGRAAASGAIGQTIDPQRQLQNDGHGGQAGSRPAVAGAARKRPRWIDRDT